MNALAQRLTAAEAAAFARAIEGEGLVPPGFDLLPAGPADLDALVALARACFAYNTPTRRELRYFLTRAHALFLRYVERASGALAAYTLVELHRGNQSLYANTTCVDPAFRGRGIGRSAFALRRRLAERLGYRIIRTHIAVDNAASLHLAAAAGYEITETIADYYSDGKSCHALRLTLPPPSRSCGS